MLAGYVVKTAFHLFLGFYMLYWNKRWDKESRARGEDLDQAQRQKLAEQVGMVSVLPLSRLCRADVCRPTLLNGVSRTDFTLAIAWSEMQLISQITLTLDMLSEPVRGRGLCIVISESVDRWLGSIQSISIESTVPINRSVKMYL